MTFQKGYSAIEMLVVMALTGTMVTLGLVSYAGQAPHYALREAARTVISDFRLIRQIAVNEGIAKSVDFDPEGRTYDLGDLRSYTLPQHIRFGTPESVHKKPNTDCTTEAPCPPPEDGITFSDDSATFLPNGVVAGYGAVYLTNDSEQGEAVAITVNMTGRITLYRWADDDWR